jgi:sugar phosphate isomerase/epimerase
MFSFFVPQDKLAENREEVMRRLRIMLDEAKEAGITLCHENEGKIYGECPEGVEDLLKTLPDLKGIFDPANYVHSQHDAVKGLEVTLPNFEYMHVKDCLYEGSVIVPAGAGEGHVKEALEKIDKMFDGEVVLTVEPHLFKFIGYDRIDKTSLKIGMHFETSDEAFDFAVTKLKEVLTGLGFKEGEDKVWTR